MRKIFTIITYYDCTLVKQNIKQRFHFFVTSTWFSLEEMFCLNGCDLGHSGEDVGTVGCSPLQTVSVVNLPVTCFFIHIELDETKTGKLSSVGRGLLVILTI